MRLDELKQRYEARGLPTSEYDLAAATITALDTMLRKEGKGEDADHLSTASLDRFIRSLRETGAISYEAFVGMLRYYYVIGSTEIYIRLTKYTGGIGVIENILDRLESTVSKEVRDRVMAGISIPPLGTSPDELPLFIEEFMRRLRRELSGSRLERVLSGNNHGVPDQAFAEEKIAYEMAPTFEQYLKEYHERQIAVLQQHADSGKPWFEQKITQEVVDFVKANPEIQGAVLKDGILYETKIPYDIENWLHAKTPEDKRYYACHCPFARESIRAGKTVIDPLWCHCSGGFVKRMYEVIFGRSLRAKCLMNALQGDEVCRFAIDMRAVDYKR
ncbi:MAG: hypothetical protein V1761_01980 [bacterium]